MNHEKENEIVFASPLQENNKFSRKNSTREV